MIIKWITSVPGDYGKTLRLRRAVALGLLGVGIVAMICYRYLVPGSGLPEFTEGFYLGGASGILLGALILLVRIQYLLRHPAAQKQAQIKEQDEREKAIINGAFKIAGIVAFFAEAAALFVVLPLNRFAFSVLLASIGLYSLVFLAGIAYLSKKM